MQTELKPCPFCGGHVQYVRSDPAYEIFEIFCTGCKAHIRWRIEMGLKENFGENARKWADKYNRRASNEPG